MTLIETAQFIAAAVGVTLAVSITYMIGFKAGERAAGNTTPPGLRELYAAAGRERRENAKLRAEIAEVKTEITRAEKRLHRN